VAVAKKVSDIAAEATKRQNIRDRHAARTAIADLVASKSFATMTRPEKDDLLEAALKLLGILPE